MQNKSKLSLLNVISQSKFIPRAPTAAAERSPGIPPALLPVFIRANSPLQLALQSNSFHQSRSPLVD